MLRQFFNWKVLPACLPKTQHSFQFDFWQCWKYIYLQHEREILFVSDIYYVYFHVGLSQIGGTRGRKTEYGQFSKSVESVCLGNQHTSYWSLSWNRIGNKRLIHP